MKTVFCYVDAGFHEFYKVDGINTNPGNPQIGNVKWEDCCYLHVIFQGDDNPPTETPVVRLLSSHWCDDPHPGDPPPPPEQHLEKSAQAMLNYSTWYTFVKDSVVGVDEKCFMKDDNQYCFLFEYDENTWDPNTKRFEGGGWLTIRPCGDWEAPPGPAPAPPPPPPPSSESKGGEVKKG